MKKFGAVTVSLVLASLAGCATGSLTAQSVSNQPPEYRAGYEEGCDSGNLAAGSWGGRARKDVKKYMDDKLYKMGWDDGFARCKGENESMQRMLK